MRFMGQLTALLGVTFRSVTLRLVRLQRYSNAEHNRVGAIIEC